MDKERFDQIHMIDYFQPTDSSWVLNLRIAFPRTVSGNITLIELITLCSILRITKPKQIMEFGTFNGRTTVNLALNCPWENQGHVYTVDLPKGVKTSLPMADGIHEKDDEMGYVGLQDKLFHSPQFPIPTPITQIWSDTAQLPLADWENRIDFLFVDASHSFENCMNDSCMAQSIVRKEGIIAWHDYNGWPGVTKALHEFSDMNPHMQFYWLRDTSIVFTINKKARR
jgi:hypothetical protein